MDSHEKYRELCAASTAGELSPGEEHELEEHLAVCGSCRRAKQEYEITVEEAVPALADDVASPVFEANGDWSVERAEAAFFERLRTDQNSPSANPSGSAMSEPAGRRFTYRPSQIPWAELWIPFAACVLLAIALGIVAYRSGFNRGTASTQQRAATSSASAGPIEEQISDFGHERSQFLTKLADDDKAINDFKRQVAEQTDEIKRLKAANGNAAASKQIGSQPSADASSEIAHRDSELVAAQTTCSRCKPKLIRSANSARTRRSGLRHFK